MGVNNIEKKTVAGTVSKIAFFFSLYCVVTAILILYFRDWDVAILKQTIGILAYPLFLFGSVAMAYKKWGKNVWILPSLLLVFMLLPFFVKLIGAWVLLFLGLLGIYLTARACWLSKRLYTLREFMQLFVASIALPVFYFFVVNGSGYSYIFADRAVLKDSLHVDTLFHSAIINMLVRFDIPSTGLDGVPQIDYYVLMHRWVASNLSVFGGDSSVFLAIAQQLAFLSVMFFALVLVLYFLTSYGNSIISIFALGFGILWLVASQLWDSYLVSETYAFSLAIFIAMIPVGRSWFERSYQGGFLSAIKPAEIFFAIVITTVCLLAKAPSGLVLFTYLVACILIPSFIINHKVIFKFIIPLLLTTVFIIFAINYFYLRNMTFDFDLFYYAKTFRNQFIGELMVFLFFILLFWFINNQHKKYHRAFTLVLIFVFFIGQVPGMLLESSGVYYFSFTALLIILIYGITIFADLLFLQLNKLWYLLFLNAFLIISLVIVLNIGLNNYSYRYTVSKILLNEEKVIADTALERVNKLTSRLRLNQTDERIIIYISPDYEAFWNYNETGAVGPSRRPLVVPAFIGLPLLNGVRAGLNSIGIEPGYGMQGYPASSRNYALSKPAIISNARRKGFKKVLVISEKSEKLYTL